jgi:predicted transcriptional regulator
MPTPIEKTIATSLKLPASVKAQIDHAAQHVGLSSHAYMVRTLERAAERARLRAQWDADTQEAWDELQTTGMAYHFDDVRAYFAARAKGEPVAPPELKPWRGADRE